MHSIEIHTIIMYGTFEQNEEFDRIQHRKIYITTCCVLCCILIVFNAIIFFVILSNNHANNTVATNQFEPNYATTFGKMIVVDNNNSDVEYITCITDFVKSHKSIIFHNVVNSCDNIITQHSIVTHDNSDIFSFYNAGFEYVVICSYDTNLIHHIKISGDVTRDEMLKQILLNNHNMYIVSLYTPIFSSVPDLKTSARICNKN
jgi:hypothetical protein